MAYQSFFSGSNSPTKTAPTPKGGGYTSFFGIATPKAPSQSDLAAIRAQQKADQAAAAAKLKASQPKQAPQGNLFTKAASLVKNDLIKPTVQTVEKAGNTVGAGVAAGAGLTRIAAQEIAGNQAGVQRTVANTQKVVNEKLTKGSGGVGGYVTPEQAAARGGGTASLKKDFIKPTAQAVTDIAPLVIPVGHAAEGASLLTKVAKSAAENAAVGAGTTTADQVINGQFGKPGSAKQILKGAASGAVIGGVAPLLHEAVNSANPKGARETLQTAKQNTLLDAGRKSNEADIAKATPEITTPTTGVDLLANVRPQEPITAPTEVLPTDTHITPQNTLPENVPVPDKPVINSVSPDVAAAIESRKPVESPQSIESSQVQPVEAQSAKTAELVPEKPDTASKSSSSVTPKPDNIVATDDLRRESVNAKTFTPLKEDPKFPGSFIPAKLDKVINNEELFSKYPALRDVTVEYHRPGDKKPGVTGLYDPRTKTISLPHDTDNTQKISSLIHEVQHAIQHVEGRNESTSSKTGDFHAYSDHPLEVEARAASTRLRDQYGVMGEHMSSVGKILNERESSSESNTKITEPSSDIKTTPKATQQKDSQFKSRVYERLQKEQPESLKDDVGYKRVNLKEDAAKAADIVATDKNQAYRIALGIEDHPGVTSTAVNIAMSEKALEDKNVTLYSQLVKARSLMQTRRGQEIVAEKGSVTDNSTSRYVKELLQSRLNKLGKNYLSNLNYGERLKNSSTPAQRGIAEVDRQVKQAQKTISKTSNLKVKAAQDIIDSLAC